MPNLTQTIPLLAPGLTTPYAFCLLPRESRAQPSERRAANASHIQGYHGLSGDVMPVDLVRLGVPRG